jgi:hypothetical protein
MMRGRAILWPTLLLPLSVTVARADFAISLREGTTVIAKSYRIDGDKVVAYTVSGEVQLESSRVVNIRDRGADGPNAAAKPTPLAKSLHGAETPRATTPTTSAFLTFDEARARDRELALALIIANRDLLFAENRGEGKEELDKRRAEIKKLEIERGAVGKVLGPQ